MQRTLAVFLAVAAILASGCRDKSGQAAGPPTLHVLCGSSMAMPARELGRRFESNHQVEVVFDLGGSETLLPKILMNAPADIFICHDPFEQKIKDAGRWAGSANVGVLQPVLLVRPGNPLNINSIADLARPGTKIGIGDPRYSTCGELFVKLLEDKHSREAVMRNVRLQGRTHAEIVNGMILGPLDAVVVWNFAALLYKGKVQLVPTADRYPEIKVTVVGLSQCPHPKMRDAFLAECRKDETRALFAHHGFAP
ncbi:MAG: substrate-binding domain-containing protein [Lentisphaerae bacterium]|nr:substrate-binding domain-containing protein [Lentisphaerota bacterium]